MVNANASNPVGFTVVYIWQETGHAIVLHSRHTGLHQNQDKLVFSFSALVMNRSKTHHSNAVRLTWLDETCSLHNIYTTLLALKKILQVVIHLRRSPIQL